MPANLENVNVYLGCLMGPGGGHSERQGYVCYAVSQEGTYVSTYVMQKLSSYIFTIHLCKVAGTFNVHMCS